MSIIVSQPINISEKYVNSVTNMISNNATAETIIARLDSL